MKLLIKRVLDTCVNYVCPLFVWFQSGGDNLLEKKDQYGKTVVHYAAARCNVNVRILVSLGKDVVNRRTSNAFVKF